MKYLKKKYQKLKPYHSTAHPEGILLNSNESPFCPPKKILDEFYKELKNIAWNRYPDMDEVALKEKIALAFEISKENVAVGVGSDELIDVIFRAVLEPQDKVLSFSPSFSMYQVFADLVEAELIPVYSPDNFILDAALMLSKIVEHHPKIILLCMPNNPTGQILTREEIEKIIQASDALVILDLAYEEFAESTLYDLAVRYDNVIALKTFSKAFALPSIRLGMAFAKKENIEMIQRVKPPYTVNSLTQLLGGIAVSYRKEYQEAVVLLRFERQKLYQELSKWIKVYSSQANFLLCEMDKELYERLEAQGIYIRRLTDQLYRISVGDSKENKALIRVVKTYAKK